MFSGQDFIANLSDQLKLIDPIFITWDDIGKLLFVIRAAFWPLKPAVCFAHQSTDVAPI